MEKKINATEKFCTRCGKKFVAVGREVICPACKAQAAEDAKRAAVLRAKQASWTGESVPVRISGRASTVIRAYGAANGMSFATALDALLQSTPSFQSAGKVWGDIVPYKSRRMKQDAPQDKQDAPQQDAPQASKPQASKPQAAQAAKTTSKAAKKAAKTAKK